MTKISRSLSIIFLLVIIFIFANSAFVYAAGTGVDGLFPSTDTLDIHSIQPKLFDKYPITNYMFDTAKFSIWDSWANIFTSISDFIFMLLVFIAYGANYLLMAAFKFNIFNLIATGFDQIIWAIRDSVFTPLLKPILSIVGITILFNAVIGKFGNAWRIILNTVIVLVIAFLFLAQPSYTIDMVNQASQDLSGEVLASTSRVVTGSNLTADDAVINLGNIFWTSTVTKPWEIIEFGTTNVSDADVESLLRYQPGSDLRDEKAKELADNYFTFTTMGSIVRLAILFFAGILMLIMIIFILALAAITVILQFAAIMSAIFMVVSFLISLLPKMGINVAIHSLYNTFGFLLAKIGMVILLAIYFAMNTVIYKLSGDYGWFIVSVLQILLIVTIVLYRKKIMGFTYSVTGGQQAAIENVYRGRDTFKNMTRSAVGVYAAKKMYDDVKHMRETRRDEKLTERTKPLAMEFMTQRYTTEKRTAEAHARIESQKTGEYVTPEYSDFVKRVDGRVDKGFTPFDERDINSTVEMMKSLEKQGNDPRNLLTTKIEGNSDKKIQVKQRELERNVDTEKKALEDRKKWNQEAINKNIKSDTESKLYDRGTARKTKLNEYEKEVAATMAENPEYMASLYDPDFVVLSTGNERALDEINKDRINKEYNALKKQESLENSQREQNVTAEKLVVNGNNGGRPIGRPVSNSSIRKATEHVENENRVITEVNQHIHNKTIHEERFNRNETSSTQTIRSGERNVNKERIITEGNQNSSTTKKSSETTHKERTESIENERKIITDTNQHIHNKTIHEERFNRNETSSKDETRKKEK